MLGVNQNFQLFFQATTTTIGNSVNTTWVAKNAGANGLFIFNWHFDICNSALLSVRPKEESAFTIVYHFLFQNYAVVSQNQTQTHTYKSIGVIGGGFPFHISFFILDNKSIKRNLSLHGQLVSK